MEKLKNISDSLFEYSGIALAILNSDGTFFFINNKFEQLSEYSKKEITQISFIDMISGKQLYHITNFLDTAKNEQSSKLSSECFECKFTKHNGQQKIILLTLNWLPKYKKFIVSYNDITRIKKEQLNLMRSEHFETIALLGSGVAHKVRNPLSAINTSVEILKDGLELDGEDLELMNIICQETMNLNRIIKDFINFTRIEEPVFNKIQINSLINKTLLHFPDDFWKGINKNIILSDKMPDIYADKEQIKQVLIHIITNAVEAMPFGGKLTIFSLNKLNQYQENQIQIIITDTGTGIDESDKDLILKPFFTTNNTKAGLGLSFCERVIYNHNGEIKIESTFDEGTKVTIYLPV